MKATNYASVDAAVSWMFEHADVAGAGPSTQRMKLVVVVNNTQSMGTGKIASQCCHGPCLVCVCVCAGYGLHSALTCSLSLRHSRTRRVQSC